jgi:glucosamine-6-phosphate deaminase
METSRTEAEQFERIRTKVFQTSDQAVALVAASISRLIRQYQQEGRDTVLGLATGSTPVKLYRELIRLHRKEGLSFRNVVTFNLDEYYGLPPHHPESYRRFMEVQLFNHIDVPPENIHVPDGMISRSEVFSYCQEYERAIRDAGGIDLQILGIGRTGHIGFNEPGSGIDSRTRMVALDRFCKPKNSRCLRGANRRQGSFVRLLRARKLKLFLPVFSSAIQIADVTLMRLLPEN